MRCWGSERVVELNKKGEKRDKKVRERGRDRETTKRQEFI